MVSWDTRFVKDEPLEKRARHLLPLERTTAVDPGSRSLFVDNARFCSIVAIIAFHAVSAISGVLSNSWTSSFGRALEVWVKFGTIDFFIISGFLLGERFETGCPSAFIQRKAKKILVPWAVWFVLMTSAKLMTKTSFLHGGFALNVSGWNTLCSVGKDCLFSTAFWFVPNLLLSLCLLLIVRKKLRSWYLGSGLLLISCFYALNIYGRWIPSSHTVALGGFSFFLWAGALMARHFEWLLMRVSRVTTLFAVSLVVLTGLMSFAESTLLFHLGGADPVNTLRVTNQLYSAAVLLLLLKLPTAIWPKSFHVRNETFGVYLSHSLILAVTLRIITPALIHLRSPSLLQSAACTAAVGLLLTTAVFCLSAVVTQMAATLGAGWMVGHASSNVRSKEERGAILSLRFIKSA